MASMRFRKLRIAWSVVWSVVAVLLVALWVRSYQGGDLVGGPIGDSSIEFVTWKGILRSTFYGDIPTSDWRTGKLEGEGESDPPHLHEGFSLGFGDVNEWLEFFAGDFACFDFPNVKTVEIPIWFTTALVLTTAAMPWRRFSLRTLLIATMLLAVVLGLAVYANRT